MTGWAVATWTLRGLGVVSIAASTYFLGRAVVRGAARYVFGRGES